MVTIKVGLKLYGNLRRYADGRREHTEHEIPQGATVHDLLTLLDIPEQAWWMIAVNDGVTTAQHVLKENDLVEVFEPVGGG